MSFCFCFFLQRTYTLIVEAWDWDNKTRESKFKPHLHHTALDFTM